MGSDSAFGEPFYGRAAGSIRHTISIDRDLAPKPVEGSSVFKYPNRDELAVSGLTPAEIERLLSLFSEVTVSPMYMVRRVCVDINTTGTFTVMVTMDAIDRERRTPIELYAPTRFDPEIVRTREDAAAIVRRALIQALTHEVDECVRWTDTGAIVKDPHKEAA